MQTSMVYYNPAAMYRHQQTAPSGQFHAGSPMHSWYAANYHHQGGQMPTAAATPSYCMQEEPQLWHHNAATSHPAHGVFHQDFPQDFGGGSGGGGGGMPLQPQNGPMMEHATTDGRLQSTPPSGSELSSPGPQGGSGNISPQATQTRPQQVRSPYDWIKKTSYQTLPNPGKTRTKDKYRVVYTDHQRIELEKEFMFNNKYITIRRKSELASNLGLSERQIKIWFQNRRAKERKQAKKRIEEKSQIEQLHQVHQQNNPHHHHHHHHGLYVSNHHQVMATNNLKEEAVKVEDVWQKAVI